MNAHTKVEGTLERVTDRLKYRAKEAIQIQDACNGLGLINAFAEVAKDVRDYLEVTNFSTGAFNTHPIIQLWVSKLHDLARMGLSDCEAYGKAYDACQKLAGEEQVNADNG